MKSDKGYTLLMLFCSVKEKLNARDLRVNLDVIRFLLQRGASKEITCKKGKTALNLSKRHFAKEEVIKLLENVRPTQYRVFSSRPQIIQHQVVK